MPPVRLDNVRLTHKLLYIPAFFALMTLIGNLTLIGMILTHGKHLAHILSDLFLLAYLILLIVMPLIKCNKILFLVPIGAIFYFKLALLRIYHHYYLAHYGLERLDFFPFLWYPIMEVLLHISGLTVLMVRIYGYWQERRAGKRTKF